MCVYMLVIKSRSFGRFWPVSCTITQFWGPEVISTIDEPRGMFMCRSSTLTYSADSSPFCALSLSVLGSFMCPSSTLRVLANSDGFRGLLLTVLGSQRDFHFCRTPRCACVWSSRLAVLADFGPFLNYYTVLASRSDFHD